MELNYRQEYHHYQHYLHQLKKIDQQSNSGLSMLTLSFFTMAFFALFAIKPTLTTIANLHRQIKDSSLLERKLQEKINNLSRVQLEYEKNRPAIAKIDTVLPDEVAFEQLLVQLEQLNQQINATKSSLFFTTITVVGTASASPKTDKDYDVVAFKIGANSSYTDILSFLSGLENFQRLLTLNLISLNSQKSRFENSLNLQSNLETYFYRPKN